MTDSNKFNGETYARYASPEQFALVKWAGDAHIAAMRAIEAVTMLSEASGLRYAVLNHENEHIAGMITERRERAIKELLRALEIIGYEGEVK